VTLIIVITFMLSVTQLFPIYECPLEDRVFSFLLDSVLPSRISWRRKKRMSQGPYQSIKNVCVHRVQAQYRDRRFSKVPVTRHFPALPRCRSDRRCFAGRYFWLLRLQHHWWLGRDTSGEAKNSGRGGCGKKMIWNSQARETGGLGEAIASNFILTSLHAGPNAELSTKRFAPFLASGSPQWQSQPRAWTRHHLRR